MEFIKNARGVIGKSLSSLSRERFPCIVVQVVLASFRLLLMLGHGSTLTQTMDFGLFNRLT